MKKIETKAKTQTKTSAKPIAKVSAKAPAKPVAKPAAKPVAKAVVKTVSKPVVKAVAKAAAKAIKKPEVKTPAKSATNPEVKTTSPKKINPPAAVKVESEKVSAIKETMNKEKSKTKSDAKSEDTMEMPAPKSAAKAESKSEPKAEAKADPKVRMSKPDLKFFENLLNEKKEVLLQELGYLEDNSMRLSSKEGAGDLSSHAYHLADHATETQDREQAFHMASREGKFLYYIEEALDRVRNGTFGICKKCHKLIPKPRLEAVPTAKMCIECKSAQEKAAEAASVG